MSSIAHVDEAAGPSATVRYGKKREAIIAAATEILNQHGVKGMTLAQVAARVGLITTSVTYYFRRKEDLAAACFQRGIERLEAIVAEADGQPTASARLLALLDLFLATCRRVQQGEEPPIPIFSDIRALEEEHRRPVGLAYTDLFRHIRALFRGAVDSPAAASARTQMLMEQLHWSAAWLYRYDVEDYPRVRDRMHDILVGGLAAPGAEWAPSPLDVAGLAGAGGQRETFLRAATKLINHSGYRGASVEKISAELNVTKGSFYHHHSAKDDVVVSCFHHAFERVRQVQLAARALEGDHWTRLSAAASALVAFQLSDRGPLLRASALSALPEPIRDQMVALANRASDRWAAMISDGVAQGSIRPVDPVIAAQMLNASVNAAADLPMILHGVSEPVALAHYARPMLMGILAE